MKSVAGTTGTAPIRRSIYHSKNYSIETMEFGSTDAVVVSFAERTHPTRLSGEKVFLKYRLNTVFVTSRGAHWYQYKDSPAAGRAVREYCTKYGRVITYGESMGAYGALAFSRLIEPNLVLAYSPQFSLDPVKVPSPTPSSIDTEVP